MPWPVYTELEHILYVINPNSDMAQVAEMFSHGRQGCWDQNISGKSIPRFLVLLCNARQQGVSSHDALAPCIADQQQEWWWWIETYIVQTYPVKTAQGAGQKGSESHINRNTTQKANYPEINTTKAPRGDVRFIEYCQCNIDGSWSSMNFFFKCKYTFVFFQRNRLLRTGDQFKCLGINFLKISL